MELELKNNIFSMLPDNLKGEAFQELAKTSNSRVERIISSKENQFDRSWYDQKEDEFVILLQGSARLEFSNEKVTNLSKGDYIFIKAHDKHRLLEVSTLEDTIWLAFFIDKASKR